MNFRGRHIVLVGSALPSNVAAQYREASVAAAKWQMDFASAVAAGFGTPVHCLSFLPLGPGETGPQSIPGDEAVRVTPIVRRRGPVGILSYVANMCRRLFALRSRCGLVLCYNPSPWTAPWAKLLSVLTRAPMIMIVADLAPHAGSPARKALAGLERTLLNSASRFLLLSEATREILPPESAAAVFAGLADDTALSHPLPMHSGIPKFVFTGSLAEYGGVQVFLEAALLIPESVGCEFHVFGKGDIPQRFAHDLEGRLQVHGFVEDFELNAFLAADCAGVNPRIDPEGTNRYNAPYKLLYYLSRGVPTISTQTPGVSAELASACVIAGVGAVALAGAMQAILDMTPEQRTELGKRGRNAVQMHHDREALLQRLKSILP